MRRFVIIAAILIISGAGLVWAKPRISAWIDERAKSDLPPAEQLANTIVNRQLNVNETLAPVPVPIEKNVAVPFTSQAPHANWDDDHNEFCEEASILMVGRYFQGRPITGPDDAEAALQRIKTWELENLGYYYDTTAAETARVAEGVYDVSVELVTDPTIDDIKVALATGKLVIVPAAGQELGNPNFTPPGPIYHMLVLRGYTRDGKFITNDPGTRRGEQYVYDQQVIINAMHDWVPGPERTKPRNGSVATGRKVILVVSPKL